MAGRQQSGSHSEYRRGLVPPQPHGGRTTEHAGTWDGDEDWDGDAVTNLEEVISGYRLDRRSLRYNIYDRNSVPPASSPSSASADLGTNNGAKTVTITYLPNDGTLNGTSPVRVRIMPTGGGTTATADMTQVNSNEFTYAYVVPAGVTSISYSF